MITLEDLNRLEITTDLKKQRVRAASKAWNNATTEWAENFWFDVMKKLTAKYGDDIRRKK